MPESEFNPIKIRLSLTPTMRRNEMARRMGISETYLRELENGTRGVPGWPHHRKAAFLREVELWKLNPDAKPRKRWGRRKGFRYDGTPVPPKIVASPELVTA